MLVLALPGVVDWGVGGVSREDGVGLASTAGVEATVGLISLLNFEGGPMGTRTVTFFFGFSCNWVWW